MRWVFLAMFFACGACGEVGGSTPPPKSATRTDREREAAIADWEARRAADLKARKEQDDALAAATLEAERMQQEAKERALARREEQLIAEAAAEAELLRASCAADREQRMKRREREEAERKKLEEQRVKAEALAELLKRNCKRREQALTAPTNEICENEDGTLRRCTGIFGVEIIWECPANGPPGARGIVKGGGGPTGNPNRVARAATRRGPTRDEQCADADREAAAPPTK